MQYTGSPAVSLATVYVARSVPTVTVLAIAVVAVKLAANTVPSAPFWDHARLSLAA
jgi:hypothetical protein